MELIHDYRTAAIAFLQAAFDNLDGDGPSGPPPKPFLSDEVDSIPLILAARQLGISAAEARRLTREPGRLETTDGTPAEDVDPEEDLLDHPVFLVSVAQVCATLALGQPPETGPAWSYEGN